MAIVTYAYYTDTYLGATIAQADFPRIELRAEQMINALTGIDDYSSFPEKVQTAVKNAICAQCEYFDENGLQIALSGKEDASYTLGKIRVDRVANADVSGTSSIICPQARIFLERTGLLYRGVPVFGDVRGVFL